MFKLSVIKKKEHLKFKINFILNFCHFKRISVHFTSFNQTLQPDRTSNPSNPKHLDLTALSRRLGVLAALAKHQDLPFLSSPLDEFVSHGGCLFENKLQEAMETPDPPKIHTPKRPQNRWMFDTDIPKDS